MSQIGRPTGPSLNSQKLCIRSSLPGTLDQIETQVRKKYPNVLRSTLRGRLSDLCKSKKVTYYLNDEHIKVYENELGFV